MLSSLIATPTAAPDPTWYFRLHGLIRGPVSWDELQRLAEAGTLKPSDAVRRGEDGPWVLASRARHDEPVPQVAPPVVAGGAAGWRGHVPMSVAAGSSPQAHGQEHVSVPPVPVDAVPAAAAAAPPGRPAGTALLALGLSLAGLFTLALPLGMLSLYLGGRSAARLARTRRPGPTFVALAAVLVALADVAAAVTAIVGRLNAGGNPFGVG